MKKQRENKGITLIALVITIIILLILAGISISSLTNNGLFGKAQDADKQTEIAQIKEDMQLGIYEKLLQNLGTISDAELESILKEHGTINYEDGTIKGITTEKGYEIPISEIYTGKITLAPKRLARVVNVGDYVEYTPDTVTTEAHNTLISELETYSGNTDKSYNTATTTKQDTLNWRVLDIVKDENGNDCVRLISATPTTSTVSLNSYNGYNNAVYLLDKTCNILYNNSTYAKKVQSLKIEDIEKYMSTKPTTLIDFHDKPTDGFYPIMLLQEANQIVNGNTGTLGVSEQTEPIIQTVVQGTTSWSLKNTSWYRKMTVDSFTNTKYYNLFINDGETNYPAYRVSSRGVSAISDNNGWYGASFGLFCVNSSIVRTENLFDSSNGKVVGKLCTALRPVITLSSDILVDTTDSTRDGTEVGKAYMIKK